MLPTMLASSAKILPVPEERVLVREDNTTIDLGNGHLLTFYDTPGHARHHFSIHDAGARGIFTGDTVGIRYVPELTGWDFTCMFPSTSPSEFDLAATRIVRPQPPISQSLRFQTVIRVL